MYRDTSNGEHEMYDYTSNKWNHRNNKKGLRKNLDAIPVAHSIGSLQKTAIIGISHIIREVLQTDT